MKVSQGIHYWLEYHNLHSKKTPSKPTSRSFQDYRPFWRKGFKLPDLRRSSLFPHAYQSRD